MIIGDVWRRNLVLNWPDRGSGRCQGAVRSPPMPGQTIRWVALWVVALARSLRCGLISVSRACRSPGKPSRSPPTCSPKLSLHRSVTPWVLIRPRTLISPPSPCCVPSTRGSAVVRISAKRLHWRRSPGKPWRSPAPHRPQSPSPQMGKARTGRTPPLHAAPHRARRCHR